MTLEDEHQEALSALREASAKRSMERQFRFEYLQRQNNGHDIGWRREDFLHYCTQCGATDRYYLITSGICPYGEA